MDEFNRVMRSTPFVIIDNTPHRTDIIGDIANLDIGDYLMVNEFCTLLQRKSEFERLYEEVSE